MEFVETSVFTKQIEGLLSADDYRALQLALWLRPDQGALIRSSGGLRKMRWGTRGRGKRGGIRTIYYWDQGSTIYLIFAYAKNKQESMTSDQLRILSTLVKEQLK